MTSSPAGPARPRRVPAQARSRERVDAILEAASRAFTRDGFDGATMEGIAAAAGTSIGSVYQFFPNKLGLLAAIADRQLIATGAVFDEVMGPQAPARTWQATIHALVDGFFAVDETELFWPVRANWHLVQSMPGRGHALHRAYAARSAPFVAAHLPGIPSHERILIAAMVAEIIGAMLFLTRQQGGSKAAAIVARTKQALIGFLAPFAHRPPRRKPARAR